VGQYNITAYSKLPQGRMRMNVIWESVIYGNTFDVQNKIISHSKFSTGNNRDNDVIFYPNDIDFTIKFYGDTDKWKNILLELSTIGAEVNVYIMVGQNDERHRFSGMIVPESVDGDLNEKIISFKAADEFELLKKIDPRTNPFDYVLTNDVSFVDLFYSLFSLAGIGYISEVTHNSTYEAQYSFEELTLTAPFERFGTLYSKYFSSNSFYSNLADMIKGILTSFGCIGYVGFDRKFYIVSRVYQGQGFITIDKDDIGDKTPTEIVRKQLGLKAYVYTGAPGTFQTTTRGDVTKDPSRVQELRIMEPTGLLPDGSTQYSGLRLYDPAEGWLAGDFNKVRRKNADGTTFTSYKSNWLLTVDDAWSLIQNDRFLFKPKVQGEKNAQGRSSLFDVNNIGSYYKLPQASSKVLRPRRMEFDAKRDEVEIELLE